MLLAWRNELLCVLAAAGALAIVGMASGALAWSLGVGLAAYGCWHAGNFVALQRWIAHGRRFRLPASLGVWEAVFDGLQRRQLRNRRRRSVLARALGQSRRAAERLPDGLVLLAADHTVLWFNSAAAKLLALARERDQGAEITALIDHPLLPDILVASDPTRMLEIASPANGAWILSIQVTAAFDLGHRLLVARDITSFHGVEQVRHDFVVDVSHELRTPITVFRGYLETLRGEPTSAPLDAALSAMEGQAQRMQELVDDLLVLSRLEMTPEARTSSLIEVAEMLEDIVEDADALSGDQGHQLDLKADPDLALWGDRTELHSAFSNLVFNAVRHTPPDTRVSITWEGDADQARLTVADSGPGIAPHHLPRLTERFYRVDPSRSRRAGGSGLGLAIVNQVLRRHGAELRIFSVPGQGSTFRCHFPGSLIEIQAPLHAASASRH